MDSDLLGAIQLISQTIKYIRKICPLNPLIYPLFILPLHLNLDGISWNSFQCVKGFTALILALLFLIRENSINVSSQIGACQIYPAQHETS